MRLIDADELKRQIIEIQNIMSEQIVEDGRNDLISFVKGLEQTLNVIDSQSIIETEQRKKGKWVATRDELFWRCNRCNESELCLPEEKSNFCPHCGADMRGEQRSEKI